MSERTQDAIAEPDHGLTARNELDDCELGGENQGVSSERVEDEETGETTRAWLCAECIDRIRAYSLGDESALDDVTEKADEVDR